MDRGLITAAQLSSLFPSSQSTSISIQSSRPSSSLTIPDASTIPNEHASYSAVLHTPITGTILLRVLHGGFILEIVSLSTSVAPVRFVFQSMILSAPAIFLWEAELHILAVTNTGSLYRLIIPVDTAMNLWARQLPNISHCEYHIKHLEGTLSGLVHVHGTHCIVIGQPGGSILRLESEYSGDSGIDEWNEIPFQHTSFLSSLTSFIPTLSSTPSSAAEIVSIATHTWPTDVGHVWTLSRDRTLRFWKAKIGCVATKLLSSVSGREASPALNSSTLLEAERQTLLRVFSTPRNEDHFFVLAFIPTPSSAASGGRFQLTDTASDQFYDVGTIECSRHSAHCHLQDFMVVGEVLYTLWDRQGQSMVEKTTIRVEEIIDNGGTQPIIWQNSTYASEPELTPAYLDELLVSPASLTAKFFEAIMRPGMFSALTLRTAIEQYSDACASLPGPLPAALTTTYASVGENIAAVVGCTVSLQRDPHTGALQHTNYWSALKRDWEGFIARCRELERSARWPLVLAARGQNDIIIVERERVGALVSEDVAIRLERNLKEDRLVDPSHAIFGVLWGLQAKLGTSFMLSLESRLLDIVQQESAFSFADIVQDQAARVGFEDQLDDGAKAWMAGRLQTVPDLDGAIRTALDIIGGFDSDVKREEDEVELLLPPPQSDWSRALTAAYITVTVNARYDLCLALLTLLFFCSEELDSWDPALLAEVFAVFRGIAVLRLISQQPTGDTAGSSDGSKNAADDVISRLQNMQVSRSLRGTHFTPTYSLIHTLLIGHPDTLGLPGAAHRFLDSTGLLQSISPAMATKYEVIFCERLRTLGQYAAAGEVLTCLPRTAGVNYVQARLYLSTHRPDESAHILEKLAGAFSPNNALSSEDHETLYYVLPTSEAPDSAFTFYLHAAKLFKAAALVQYEVSFTQMALSVAPLDVDTSPLWATVIKGYTELSLYDDAYSALVATPHDKEKREGVGQLVYRMCEDGAVEKLVSYSFPGFADEVEEALAFKARNIDPRIQPSYSRILYSWYTFKGNHRSAALVMYQRARKLQDIIASDITAAPTLVSQQLQALTIAINSLSLVAQKNAWFLLPVSSTEYAREQPPHKRRRLSSHIPESKFTPGNHDVEVVPLSEIQHEHALLSAQMNIVKREPALASYTDLPPESIVLRLAQARQFNLAMSTAHSLKVDMTDIFAQLTTQCEALFVLIVHYRQEDNSDWLLTDKVSSWPGSPADRGWRYLRQVLERYDGPDTDYRYTKITLETLLGTQRTTPPPLWLIHSLEEHHHEYLIHATLRSGDFDQCIAHTLSLIQKADSRLSRDTTKHAASTWLPYTLIDQVLVAAAGLEPPPPGLSQLRVQLDNRLKRMQRLTKSNLSG
ncbi:hypothetical protein MIND_00725000 [Mycena indigotica]|uniref:Nucleoporin Nup120/160-domain-containing protein n=1 Tax=Mycena indigotica TaxID=2126181 RepID=A0A8H6SKU9_9AGAR|nr:uncharacterized protein MIND_00725000 [Mycena indigotica]KAF7301595.1 hypothetical protein MIND_00725000 [Mycena indigotica]